MKKKELIKEFEYSIENVDNSPLKVKVKITKEGPLYSAHFSHELKKTHTEEYYEYPAGSILEDVEYRVKKYLDMFENKSMSDILINEEF